MPDRPVEPHRGLSVSGDQPTPGGPARITYSAGGHNHITRDIKRPGECPACDVYLANHPTTRPSRREARP